MIRTNPDSVSYKTIAYIIFGLLLLATIGAFSAIRFAEDGYNRDVRHWETALNTTADIRADAVEKWLKEQFDTVRSVADNLSIRLYITELGIASETTSEEPSQITFIRNYLIETANRSGFSSDTGNRKVRANVKPSGSAGIALLNKNKKIITATDSMPEITDELQDFINGDFDTEAKFKDIYLNSSKTPSIAFLTPVFSVQGSNSKDDIIGAVLGVKTIDEHLFPLLKHPKSAYRTEESLLIRKNGEVVEYISPLKDGTPALILKLNLDDPEFSAKFAIDNPNIFAIKKDYLSNNVLVTGRKINNAPWFLIHKINYSESLAESDKRRNDTITIFLLVIGFVFAFILAMWRHGASVRAEKESKRYRHLFEQFKSQERLLRLVADNQPEAIFITDTEGNYLFVNAEVAHSVGMNDSDIIGKRMKDVFGADKAHGYEEHNKTALKNKTIVSAEKRADGRVIQSKHVPLKEVPVILTGEEKPGVLIVEQDITAAISEREKRGRILDQVINTLVTVVDRRDSYSAKHSERVAEVSKVIAKEMGLEKIYIETAHAAGRLMNLGKIELDPKILTKKGKLTKDERKKVENSILTSAELIKEVEFEGPVVKTLEQSQENWDGSGPLGLKGGRILVTARVIAVANAFVAMTSPRAYRPKIKQETIIKTLLEEASRKYERRVVVSLISCLENNKDLFKWNK